MKSKEKRRIHEEEKGDDAFLSPDDENDDVEEDENADPSTPSRSSADDGLRSPLRQVNAPGKPAEAGVITKIYCENFMCHRKLTVSLNRNVNL